MKPESRKQFVVLPENYSSSPRAGAIDQHVVSGMLKRCSNQSINKYVQIRANREVGRSLGYIFPDKEPAPLARDDIRQRFWNLLRMKNILTVPDAVSTLVDAGDDVRRAQKRLNEYLVLVEKIGYVTCRRGHTNTWLLVVNTGQLAPTIDKRSHCIFDRNNGEWLAWVE